VFSSLAGVTGNTGQADYAAANAFADHFAARREELVARGERRGRTLAVNWQLWWDGGMRLTEEQVRAAADRTGLAVLDTATGLGRRMGSGLRVPRKRGGGVSPRW